jgi:hypothetical protein
MWMCPHTKSLFKGVFQLNIQMGFECQGFLLCRIFVIFGYEKYGFKVQPIPLSLHHKN